ncbi:Ig-like domain-containing protein [Paenibacillus chartarius]|uniref:Ig-like domain-containing protein n=1 Tax=Paenibacillus chartarius TaxID=747481 RepID=A0ABV6DUF5_9BACL
MVVTKKRHFLFILGICIVILFTIATPAALGATTEDYTILEEVPGKILDFDDTRILYAVNESNVIVRDRSTKQETTITSLSYIVNGYFTGNGALIVTKTRAGSDDFAIYEWNGGNTVQLKTNVTSYHSEGNYFTFTTAVSSARSEYAIWLYDMANQVLSPVSEQNGINGDRWYGWGNVSADGHLVYTSKDGYIVTFFQGNTILTDLKGSRPVTDGNRILYTKENDWNESMDLYIYKDYKETYLNSFYDVHWYDLSNGWIAYHQMFRYPEIISPDGQTITLHHSKDYFTDKLALNKNGELVFLEGSTLIYTNPSMNGNVKTLANPLFYGISTFIYNEDNDKWYAAGGESNKYYLLEYHINREPVPVPVTYVIIQPDLLLVLNNKPTASLNYSVYPENATNKKVTWESSNPQVATVQNGIVTAISPGSADIKVTTEDGNFSAICKVQVVNNVTSIQLNQEDLSLGISETFQLQALIQPQDADQRVKWHSTNSNIATVDSQGLVKGITPGTAEIIVTSWDGKITATCTVTVTSTSKVKFNSTSLLQWVDEGTGTVTATVYRVGSSKGTLTVDYATEQDTAKPYSDYVQLRGKLTFADGETVKSIQIPLINDGDKEQLESFSLRLLGPSYALSAPKTNRIFFIIRDDD